MICAIRGATTVDFDTKQSIENASKQLFSTILQQNKIDRIISLLISTTADITSFYPATAIRHNFDCDFALFSCSEPQISNSLPLCIRFLLTCEMNDNEINNVYLNKARDLLQDK